MRAALNIIGITCVFAIVALFFYGIDQFAETDGEKFFEHFGKAAFAFLLLYGCVKILRSVQKKMDQIDPGALTSRLMEEASDRLRSMSPKDEKTARAMLEKELDWIEQQQEEARRGASSEKEL